MAGPFDAQTPEWQQAAPLSMTNYKVDIDTPPGAMIRHTGDGMAVYMRFDAPGVFLNEHGKRVPEEIAAQAGFDVEELARLRKRELAKAKVLGDIDREFAAQNTRRIVVESADYRVVEVAKGYFNIEFEDGTVLNARGPVSREVAMKRFRDLTGTDEAAEAATSQPVDADVAEPVRKQAK